MLGNLDWKKPVAIRDGRWIEEDAEPGTGDTAILPVPPQQSKDDSKCQHQNDSGNDDGYCRGWWPR